MVEKEDDSGNPWAGGQVSGSRKMFWRSASWSASRTAAQGPECEGKDIADPNGGNERQSRRFPPPPLTPRSQQNCKARSCLPPLQPLSIARRSLEEWPMASSDDLGEWPQPPTPSGNKSNERLKLDLSSIQRNPEKNGGLVKRDKIAFFDKECSKVAEHIYLGGDSVARDRNILKKNGITHVLNCVGFLCSEYFKDDFVYRTLWLQDNPSEDITSILYDVFDYFEDVREQHGRIFVHCCQGVSRSTSLVIAYLMWREGQSFDDAFQFVKAARGIADPNMGFACQLLQCQKRVHAVPLSPSSLLRMYKIAPHSAYDPLHLVPKMLSDPSPSALDSRGAFIIQVPSAIYIWIGRNCEAVMQRDARGAACQIVRYEKVQGPIVMIKEGEEQAYFWDAFSNLLPLMDKSVKMESGGSAIKTCNVQRKVNAYDVDFEIFQRAIKGGFAPPLASSENEQETHLPARESCWSALRRKYTSGIMKEFVALPKISLSRVYSESRMIVHSSSPSSSSSSSSSSPPYLSPDSISSDSSSGSKYSESSLDSPSAASCPLPLPLSNFSNLSIYSSKTSEPKSNSQELVGKNCISHPCPRPVPSASLAERRGSLSKSLKLPVAIDNIRENPSSVHVCQEDGVRKNNTTYSSHEPDIEIVFGSKVGGRKGEGSLVSRSKISPGSVTTANRCGKGAVFCNSNGRSRTLDDEFGSAVLKGVEESGSSEPLVYSLPSLERMRRLSTSNLDSKSAFAILTPRGLGKSEVSTLCVWVGRSFSRDKRWAGFHNSGESGDEEEVDWYQISASVLARLALPKDTPFKIVQEDEAPRGFLASFSTS